LKPDDFVAVPHTVASSKSRKQVVSNVELRCMQPQAEEINADIQIPPSCETASTEDSSESSYPGIVTELPDHVVVQHDLDFDEDELMKRIANSV
jgi:hypothetical protein